MNKTITITTIHGGFEVGDEVEVSGASPSNNGKFKVTSVDNNSFDVTPVRICLECNIGYTGLHPVNDCVNGCFERVMEA